MTAGIHHDTIIKIGFLNYNIEENLEVYANSFDIVILNDGSVEHVNNLMKN